MTLVASATLGAREAFRASSSGGVCGVAYGRRKRDGVKEDDVDEDMGWDETRSNGRRKRARMATEREQIERPGERVGEMLRMRR